MTAVPLDAAWLRANPLPGHEGATDKNSRGRVAAAGGSRLCPGGLLLTAEAAMRAGAGKVQMATVGAVALAIGLAMPEAAVIALDEDDEGEIAGSAAAALAKAAGRSDCLALGPGMGDRKVAAGLVEQVLETIEPGIGIVLDAAAVACSRHHVAPIRRHEGHVMLTPHHGEMAALTGEEPDVIADDPERVAAETAARFAATVVLKAGETVIAAPDGTVLRYAGGGVGLATGGSGDVLAGIAAGLLARGAGPLCAAGWAVWLHGEAGRRLAERVGATGFLARELLPLVPALMREP